MLYILRSVLMGLHRFAPPSDKAELDASAAGSQEWRYLWAYLWPQTFSAFSSTCIEKNPTHNLWHYNTDKKKKPRAPVSSMLALSRPRRPRSTSCSRVSKEWAIVDRSDGVNC